MSDPAAQAGPARPWPAQDGPAHWHAPGQAGRWYPAKGDPDPAWALPPAGARPVQTHRRGRWAGVLVLVISLVGCLFAAAPGRPVPGSAGTTFIGSDGHHERLGDTQLDWAWLPGGRVFADGPTMLLSTIPSMESALRTHWVRQTRTYADRQDFVLHDVEGGTVRTHVEILAGVVTTYEPALLTLPNDVAAGATWTSSGTRTRADQALPYTSTGSAVGAADGCLLVTTEIRVGSAPERTELTWCPGRGIVAGTGFTTAATPAPTPVTTEPDRQPTDPASWRLIRPDLLRHGAGTVSLQGMGVPLVDGRAVVNRSSGDVIVFNADVAGYRQRVNAHAGGEVVSAASFGDAMVVATTLRRLTAFDRAGRWLWSAPEDEIAVSLTRLGPDSFISIGADGAVRAYRTTDGMLLWQHATGAEVRLPAGTVNAGRAGPGLVVLAARDRRVVALSAAGAPRWETTLEDSAVALQVDAEAVHVLTELGDLVALDPSTGAVRWTRRLPMAPTTADIVRAADRLVVRSGDQLVSLDAAIGQVRWRHRVASRAALVAGGRVVLVQRERIAVLDADGAELNGWPLDPVADSGLTCTTTSRGLACLGAGQNPLVLLEAP